MQTVPGLVTWTVGMRETVSVSPGCPNQLPVDGVTGNVLLRLTAPKAGLSRTRHQQIRCLVRTLLRVFSWLSSRGVSHGRRQREEAGSPQPLLARDSPHIT